MLAAWQHSYLLCGNYLLLHVLVSKQTLCGFDGAHFVVVFWVAVKL